MDKEINGDQVVYAAGNSWIVCRSKSHSGRIYYFNTLTGEAAWNLSDAEIEKAKCRTKSLATQENINIGECPEPKEPPIDQTPVQVLDPPTSIPSNRSQSSKIYNKQIINNQFSKQTYPISPFLIPSFSHVVANPINSIMPFAVNTPNPIYNSNVWAVPPTHQIYIGPTLSSPLVNQAQTASVNVPFENEDHKVLVQTTSNSISGRFKNLRNKSYDTTQQNYLEIKNKVTPTKNQKKWRRQDHTHRNFKNNLGNFDLRKVLSAKRLQRRSSFKAESEKNEGLYEQNDADNADDCELSAYESENEDTNISHIEEPKNKNDEPNDADWLEENILLEGGQLKINVSNLKKLAKPDMDPDCWYIVADKDILLHHLNFLNILCHSDKECLLMVPQQVMAELRAVSRGEGAVRRARRAVGFLLQQMDAGYVVIGDSTCGENDTRCDYLLSCCSNLLEQNSHVILLSNDDDFKEYANSTDVPIFSIKELKQFLTKSASENQSDKLKPPPQCKSPETQTERLKPQCNIEQQCISPIKITVPNDLLKDLNDTVISLKLNKGTQFNVDSMTERLNEYNSESVNRQKEVHSPVKAVDAGVQTDLQTEAEPLLTTDNTFRFPEASTSDNTGIISISQPENTTTCQLTKREIRLNRSLSIKTSASREDTTVEKKSFKWRRRRHASGTAQYDSGLSLANSNVDESSGDLVNTQRNDKTMTSNELQLPQHKDESISSETSSFIVNRNAINDSVIVEESSTSGVISNSPSNVDSETENGIKPTVKLNLKQTEPRKSIMFNITDQIMEDSLRTMNDEWVSRFHQIMEEILTQVLRKDQHFLRAVVYKLHGGGPWTIREATECIKIKFSNNPDITDAANKLSNILMNLSDNSGRITVNLQPSEFMEMYSFGVYLIETLQSVLNNCEDLQTAAQSLLKLLNDIQNPHSSHNDTFGDTHHQETTADINSIQSTKAETKRSEETTPTKQVIKRKPEDLTPPSAERAREYNLRSKHKNLSQVEDNNSANKNDEDVTFIRRIDVQDTFFSSLKLVKKSNGTDPVSTVAKCSLASQTVPNQAYVASGSQDLIKSIFDRNLNDDSQTHTQNKSPESKVVQKCSCCVAVGNNLHKNVAREPLDMDELDYSAIDDEDESYIHKEYFSDDVEYYQNEQDSLVDNSYTTNSNTNVESYLGNAKTLKNNTPVFETDDIEYFKIVDNKFNCDSPLSMNNKLNFIFNTIIGKIKEGLLDVRTFCEETNKELIECQMHLPKRKYEIIGKAERAQVALSNLCKSLTSVFYRETYEPEKNIQSVLKNAGINDFDLNDNQLNLYRDMIGKCLEQAEILQESVALIITVVNKICVE